MSDTIDRKRDMQETGVILMSPLFETGDIAADRKAAVDWGREAYNNGIAEPFTPHRVGPSIFGPGECHWPSDGGDELAELNDAKGDLPETADLAFGVTCVQEDTWFHGIKKIGNGFVAIITSTVKFAEKITEPASSSGPHGREMG